MQTWEGAESIAVVNASQTSRPCAKDYRVGIRQIRCNGIPSVAALAAHESSAFFDSAHAAPRKVACSQEVSTHLTVQAIRNGPWS